MFAWCDVARFPPFPRRRHFHNSRSGYARPRSINDETQERLRHFLTWRDGQREEHGYFASFPPDVDWTWGNDVVTHGSVDVASFRYLHRRYRNGIAGPTGPSGVMSTA